MVDRKLLEMAKVYRMPADSVIRYIYIPEIISFFRKKLGKRSDN